MAWEKLNDDSIKELPLILAGPILRRVESQSVTVWVALKDSRNVTLEIYDASKNLLFTGSRETVKLGKYLHIVAVTAKSANALQALQESNLYFYDLVFDAQKGERLDSSLGLGKGEEIFYTGLALKLPSFALPPKDLNKLRIIHASCRKPHGEGFDAFATLDIILAKSAFNPDERPHQLFLTGDQIYADDVADSLLSALIDTGNKLFNWEEVLPGINKTSEKISPGTREKISEEFCGFTSGGVAKSHLLSLSEFCAMYLFVWSKILWQDELPQNKDFDENEEEYLKTFKDYLSRVRRGLANVPTYMMFDDHEVTDDWYITHRWCKDVIQKPLGRRVIQNGLVAYALFQAWGNTPEDFEGDDKPGKQLLDTVSQLADKSDDEKLWQKIAHLVGLPYSQKEVGDFIKNLKKHKQLRCPKTPFPVWHNSINWHYSVVSSNHKVIVLDSRTWREYPSSSDKADAEDKEDKDDMGFPALLSKNAFQQQISDTVLEDDKELTVVIAPAPVIGVPLIEYIQKKLSFTDKSKYKNDTETWGFQPFGLERLFARLASNNKGKNNRVIFLSGDVHYGFAARLQYWATQPFEVEADNQFSEEKNLLVGAQLTSSALKNETRKGWGLSRTYNLHRLGYKPFSDKLPEPLKFFGWNNQSKELNIGQKDYILIPIEWNVKGNPAIVNLTEEKEDFTNLTLREDQNPHWRYRFDFILGEHKKRPIFKPRPVKKLGEESSKKDSLSNYINMAQNHKDYGDKWANGKEIVGLNNIGEITFEWENEDDKKVIQRLWWQDESPEESEDESPEESEDEKFKPLPLSEFVVSLKFNDEEYPKPDVTQGGEE